jgi:hypothetical protein
MEAGRSLIGGLVVGGSGDKSCGVLGFETLGKLSFDVSFNHHCIALIDDRETNLPAKMGINLL